MDKDQELICSAQQFCVKFLVFCFWSNHFIIAIIRYCFVAYPIETHNRYPRKEDKNDLFIKVFRLAIWQERNNWRHRKLFSCSFVLPLLLSLVDQAGIHFFNAASQNYHVCMGMKGEKAMDEVQINYVKKFLAHVARFSFLTYSYFHKWYRFCLYFTK